MWWKTQEPYLTLADLPERLCAKMEGPRPPATFLSDGCTRVFNFWIAVDCRPACHWHDWAYEIGGDATDRHLADLAFYRNLRRCDLSKPLATLRYLGVRLFGRRHFCWR